MDCSRSLHRCDLIDSSATSIHKHLFQNEGLRHEAAVKCLAGIVRCEIIEEIYIQGMVDGPSECAWVSQ